MGGDHPYINVNSPSPDKAGVGLKPAHFADVLEHKPALGFFEIHPENYMCAGGPLHHNLAAIRADYPISFHGVAASLGSGQPVRRAHLEMLKELITRFEPFVVSEHLAWSATERQFLADLLPMPYTEEALWTTTENVERMQEALGRPILVENPSTYLTWRDNDMSEPEFLAELCRRTGCGLLLDVNNVYVCASNHGFDAAAYLETFSMQHVGEIHLAGHAVDQVDDADVLIDDHGAPVCDAVWDLYGKVIERTGPVSTLIERDSNLPPAPDLWDEAAKADTIAARFGCRTERHAGVA